MTFGRLVPCNLSYVEQIHTISALLPLVESCAKYCFQHNFVVNLGQRFSCHHVNVLFFLKSVLQTFFRRSFLRSTPYKCDKGGDCLINAEKQNGSRPCPACRLVKCLDLGMSKDGTCLSLNYVQKFLISLKLY